MPPHTVTRPLVPFTGRLLPVPDGRPPAVPLLPVADRSGSFANGQPCGTREQPAAEVDADPGREVEVATRHLLPRLVEVLRGHRPASHLADRMGPFPYADLLRRARLLTRTGDDPGPAVLRSVHTQVVHPGAVEVAAHLRSSRGSVALALRWERHRHDWLCTAIDFGPSPLALTGPQSPGRPLVPRVSCPRNGRGTS